MTVYRTTDPGVAADTFAVLTIVSPGITTLAVAVHRGSADPAGQLLPAAVVAAVTAMTCPPGVGVSDDDRPGDRHRAAHRDVPGPHCPGRPTDRVPELAVSLPASLIWAAVLAVVRLTLIPS